ncbi:hypothetical protein, partial [Photobacterium sp. 1_MG-2023]|uniref:hypothetical protein n=1 Tax=Photobacterium sp. 1_MG-2023 TaxID=3062646 RepID=UPI0026E179D5
SAIDWGTPRRARYRAEATVTQSADANGLAMTRASRIARLRKHLLVWLRKDEQIPASRYVGRCVYISNTKSGGFLNQDRIP